MRKRLIHIAKFVEHLYCGMILSIVDTYEVCSIALNRPAYQSSVYTSIDGLQHTANLANDGYHNLMTCSMSNTETSPWWMISFGVTLAVTRVNLLSGVHVGKLCS